MLTCIPNVLTTDGVARLRALSRHVEYVGRTASAEKRIHDIKQNLQMARRLGRSGRGPAVRAGGAAAQRHIPQRSVARRHRAAHTQSVSGGQDLRISIKGLSADENADTEVIKRPVKARTDLLRMWIEL
jgi:hypothetical protein